MDIDFGNLDWKPMPKVAAKPVAAAQGLSMAEAKRGLAITFNTTPSAIGITIRG